MFRLSAPTVVLTLGGERVETTLEHPFFVENQGWTPAQDLITSQRLAGIEGEWTAIDHIEYTRQTHPVYNLRITADHTYFVGNRWVWGQSLNDLECVRAAQKIWVNIDWRGKFVGRRKG